MVLRLRPISSVLYRSLICMILRLTIGIAGSSKIIWAAILQQWIRAQAIGLLHVDCWQFITWIQFCHKTYAFFLKRNASLKASSSSKHFVSRMSSPALMRKINIGSFHLKNNPRSPGFSVSARCAVVMARFSQLARKSRFWHWNSRLGICQTRARFSYRKKAHSIHVFLNPCWSYDNIYLKIILTV